MFDSSFITCKFVCGQAQAARSARLRQKSPKEAVAAGTTLGSCWRRSVVVAGAAQPSPSSGLERGRTRARLASLTTPLRLGAGASGAPSGQLWRCWTVSRSTGAEGTSGGVEELLIYRTEMKLIRRQFLLGCERNHIATTVTDGNRPDGTVTMVSYQIVSKQSEKTWKFLIRKNPNQCWNLNTWRDKILETQSIWMIWN
jgi:hypothetical protein